VKSNRAIKDSPRSEAYEATRQPFVAVFPLWVLQMSIYIFLDDTFDRSGSPKAPAQIVAPEHQEQRKRVSKHRRPAWGNPV